MSHPNGSNGGQIPAGAHSASQQAEPQLDWGEDRQYVWQHVLHENEVFNTFLNFFLVFESLSLAGLITVVTSRPRCSLALAITVLGLMTSVLWLYVQGRSILLLRDPVKALAATDSYYKWLQYHRRDFPPILRVNDWHVLGIALPSLFLLIWIAAFVIIIRACQGWWSL